MVDFILKEKYDFDDLVSIVHLLRSPGGCPWDQEQTHQSIRRNFLEETCEACEAIDNDDPTLLCEELGDVLLQVLFHTDIEQDRGRFTLSDVTDGICKKLIFRHPHVFGSVQVNDTDQVLTNWEQLKQAEKGQSTQTEVLQAVSRALPSLWRAEKVQKKAEQAGFPLPDQSQALSNAGAALDKLRLPQADNSAAIGALLFSVVALCRRIGVDPEVALTQETDRFIEAFSAQESANDAK
jgi:tetrapyrrole methylase family protein/MazG family protein